MASGCRKRVVQTLLPDHFSNRDAMSGSEYTSTSLAESREILCREWSRHLISPRGGEQINLRFTHRKLSDDMTVSRLSYGAEVGIDPLDRDEVLLVQMPSQGRASARYGNSAVAMDAGQFGVIDVRRVDRVEYDADFSALVLRVRIERIRHYLEELLGRPLHHELVFRDEITTNTVAWHRWAPFVAMLSGFIDHAGTDYPARMLASVEDTVLAALVFSQPHNFGDELRRPGPLVAPRHVKRAEDYVYAHAGEALSTTMIAAHANVSVRALFDGFRTFRNMTPVEFVRGVRLDKARAELLEGGLTVSMVANKWGFAHLGNFAGHYRRRFGEAPVDTLKFSRSNQRH